MGIRRRTTTALSAGLVSVLVLALVVAPNAAAAAPRALPAGDLLIANPSFEQGLADWTAPCFAGDGGVGNGDSGDGDAGSGDSGDGSSLPAVSIGISTALFATGAQSASLRPAESCPSPTLTSTPVAATPKERYTAFVQTRVDGAVVAAASLVFLNAARAVIGRSPAATITPAPNGTSGPSDPATPGPSGPVAVGWQTLRPAGIAPPAAAFVAVELAARTGAAAGGSGSAAESDSVTESGSNADTASGTAYFDDVRISRQFTDLGTQIGTTYVRAVTFGQDSRGRNLLYAVTDGGKSAAARLVGIDIDAGQVVTSVNLNSGSPSGSWAATTASDGTIYVASFQPGMLWAYRPGAAGAKRVAVLKGNNIPFGLAAGSSGDVYIGGYPDGIVYRYLPGKGLTPFANIKKLTKQAYVRSIAVDPTTSTVYVGVGTKAGLVACDARTKKCAAVSVPALKGQQFVYQLSAAPGKVFAYLSPSNSLVALDVIRRPDGGYQATTAATIKNVGYPGASAAFDGSVYYRTTTGALVARDLVGGERTVAASYPGVRGWGFLPLADQTRYPGKTVVSAGTVEGGVEIGGYNSATGAIFKKRVIGLPGASVGLQYLQRGPDGSIYASGYPSGGLAAYTPMRSDLSVQYAGIGQAEGMATVGDTLYLGVYPRALIQSFNPTAPLRAGSNPKTRCDLSAKGQDRPYAMVEGDGKLYVGTMAGYGGLKGALTVFDPATGRCTVRRDIVRDQSIVSLAYLDGIVYGGSLVWGGFGAKPKQSRAQFLIHDTRTGRSRTLPLPVASTSVQGLVVGPDGNIWMMAGSYLLIYSVAQGKFVTKRNLFPELRYPKPPLSATARLTAYDAMLTVASDGNIYGTLHGRYFFRIDARTKKPTVLYRGAVMGIATDGFGNVYFAQGAAHLVRYVP